MNIQGPHRGERPGALTLPSFKVSVLSASLLALALGVSSCNKADAKNGQPAPQLPDKDQNKTLSGHRVEVAVVQPSRKALTLTVPGEVKGNRDAFLAAPLGGYIERVKVEEGDRVKAGAILAHIDRTTHAVRQTRAKLELDTAKRELQRAEAIAGSIPKAELDMARDRVALAEATLVELKHNSNRALIVAPFSGVITQVDAEVGEVAPPGAPLIRLVQLSPVNVSVALSDRDIGLAKVGAKARIQLDAVAGVVEGTIKSISRAANLKTRSFEALIEVENKDEALLPGMIANVTIDAASGAPEDKPKTTKTASTKKAAPDQAPAADGQLVISQDWLVTRRDGVGVFVEKNGKASWRTVELGDVLRKQVVVKSGLKPGDALIIVGHRELVDGDQVLVHRRGECCKDGRATFSQ